MDIGRLRASAHRVAFRFMRPGSVPTPGVHRSLFRGHGLNFAGYREYQYGDDIRMVDWNVTARQNRPMLKLFEQEHATALMLVLDASAVDDRAAPGQVGRRARPWPCCSRSSAARDGERIGLAVTGEKGLGVQRRGAASRTRPGSPTGWSSPRPPRGRAGTGAQGWLDDGIHRALRGLRTPGVLVIVVRLPRHAVGRRGPRGGAPPHRRRPDDLQRLRARAAVGRPRPRAGRRDRAPRAGWTRARRGSATAYAQRSLALRSEIRARLVDAGAVPVAIRTDRPLVGQLASICRVRGAA